MSDNIFDSFRKRLLYNKNVYVGSVDFYFLDLSSEVNENTKEIQKMCINKYYYSDILDMCIDAKKLGFITNNKGISGIDFEGVFNAAWVGKTFSRYRGDKQEYLWKKILKSLNNNGFIGGSYKYGNDTYDNGFYYASENFIREIALKNDILILDLWISEEDDGLYINFVMKKDF